MGGWWVGGRWVCSSSSKVPPPVTAIPQCLQQVVFSPLHRVWRQADAKTQHNTKHTYIHTHTHHSINCWCVFSVCVSSPSYQKDEGWNLESGCQQHHPASHLSVMKSFRRWSLLLKGQDGFSLSLLVFGGKCSAVGRGGGWGLSKGRV